MPRIPLFVSLVVPSLLAAAGAAPAHHGIEWQPLPDRNAPVGGTLFTTLPPERTGITVVNRFDDPRIWAERYESFAFGSIGTGVAIGDYDGDGRPDIYFAGKAERGRLYRNLGDWRFEDVTASAGLEGVAPEWETGTAFVDIDNDGDLDLFVCRTGAANLLWVNQGDGTFIESARRAGLALEDASVMAAFADYDRDGWLDVFIQTNLLDIGKSPRGQRDRLYRNRGDGTFEEVTDSARLYAQTQGHAAIWWDPDENGWPDLYVGNDFATPDQLYFNRRDGVFVNVIDLMAPVFPYFAMGMDVGDVNNDGRLDLFVADMLPTSRQQYVSGMLNMQAKTAADAPPHLAAQHMRNVLHLNTGTARFQEAATLAGMTATDWTWSVRFEDLDEDGRVDLHVTNGMFRDFMDADFLARVNQLDVAGRRRLVRAAPELREKNLAFRNRGDLQFEEAGGAWGLDHHGISLGAAFGDLDGDGDLDLVFSNYNGVPTLCRNDSVDTHRVLIALRGAASNRFGIGARLRIETAGGVQVRTLASARGYLSTSEPVVHFGLGSAERVERLTVHWPSGHVQVLEKLAVDRRYTIHEPDGAVTAVPSPPPPALFQDISEQAGLSVLMSEKAVDEFVHQPLLPWRQHTLGPSLAVGDLDGDGMDDVIVGGVAGQARRLLRQVGTRHVAVDETVGAGTAEVPDAGMLVFEADGDGRADLFVVKGGVNRPASDPAYQPQLFLGRGNGGFTEAPVDALPSFPVSAGPAVAADFDRDGRLDLFIGGRVVPGEYGATPRSALWRNEGGRFVDVTATAPGLAEAGRVQAALWTDVDQDGWVDLLVATHWGLVRCWRNEQGRGFSEATAELGFSAGGAGWWNSIAAADFNGDGALDYVVGNLGLNTRYRATSESPVVLFSGPFGPGGRTRLIECETVGERLMPIRARDSLLAGLPSLRSRVPTYHAYAQAAIDELVDADVLASARRFEVTELRSGVFLSVGAAESRRFVFKPLPRVAQLAPIFGIVAGDFDGDGRADLYAVQNTHAPHAEIGRFSGGVSQLLRGDGRGGFEGVSPQESGLVVAGEARALAVKDFDLDGAPDFVVSRRDAPTLAYLNRPAEGRRFMSVRLQHGSGNPGGVGARITLVTEGGSVTASEVYAGCGYLGQSASGVFFGYRAEDPPRELRVVWPDGEESVYRPAAGESRVRIARGE